jgi:acyl-CoA synthetase (AMP-forming)/AMP-acid ligase II
VKRVESVIGCPNDWIKLDEKPLSTVELGPEDDATIFYTSGTTGKPKGALATTARSTATSSPPPPPAPAASCDAARRRLSRIPACRRRAR